MKYSVVVPVYNVQDYLPRCIESLINQTYSNIEILLIDDGSNDRSPQICDYYANKDDRIRVIHKTNGGLSDARNTGLMCANGEYILFVDSDDYIDINTCFSFLEYAKDSIDIIVGDAIVVGGFSDFSHINDNAVMKGIDYLRKAYKAGKAPMAAWLNIYRRDFLISNDLYFKVGILHEDEEFTPRAFLCADSVVVSNITFYSYIIRENSITTQIDKRKNADDFYNTCIELEAIISGLKDVELKYSMLDSLSAKYLSLFQAGKLYKYGKSYFHKDMIRRNSKTKRTRAKALLYLISPRLYWHVNNLNKVRKK